MAASARQSQRPRRADAERSIESIVDAALSCFTERPDVSMTAIAQAAGVSRVTLYTHFPTREGLLATVLDRAVAEAKRALDGIQESTPDETLSTVVRSAWEVLGRYRNLMVAADVLSPQELREHHHLALDRIERLIVRGQEEQVFRGDLTANWLVTVFYSLIHTAAQEVEQGRMHSDDASDVLDRTVRAVVALPRLD
jgi:AcrR family transcriptional regulator